MAERAKAWMLDFVTRGRTWLRSGSIWKLAALGRAALTQTQNAYVRPNTPCFFAYLAPVLRPLPSCLSSKPRATLDAVEHRSQKELLRWCLTVFYFRPPRKHCTPERQRTCSQGCYAPVDVYLQLGIFYPTYAGSM